MRALSYLYLCSGGGYVDKEYSYPQEYLDLMDNYDKVYEQISTIKLMEVISEVDDDWELATDTYNSIKVNEINQTLGIISDVDSLVHLYHYDSKIKEHVHIVLGVNAWYGEIEGYMYIDSDDITVYLPDVNVLRYVADAIGRNLLKQGKYKAGTMACKWGQGYFSTEEYKDFVLKEESKKLLRKQKRAMKADISNNVHNTSSKQINDSISEYIEDMKAYTYDDN